MTEGKKETCKFNRKWLQCLEYLSKMATLQKLVRWCFPVLNYCNGKYILRQKRRRRLKKKKAQREIKSQIVIKKNKSITELAKLHAKFQLRTLNFSWQVHLIYCFVLDIRLKLSKEKLDQHSYVPSFPSMMSSAWRRNWVFDLTVQNLGSQFSFFLITF